MIVKLDDDQLPEFSEFSASTSKPFPAPDHSIIEEELHHADEPGSVDVGFSKLLRFFVLQQVHLHLKHS